MTDNEKRFREVYAVKLGEAIDRYKDDPDQGYDYDKNEIPLVIDKMIPVLAKGGAYIGPALRATAKALGIKPSIGAIRTFLNAES